MLTMDQLKKDVNKLKIYRSWKPLTIYRVVMILACLMILLTIAAVSLLMFVAENKSDNLTIWWVFVIAGLQFIMFACVMVICAKKYSDRLSYHKGYLLNMQLKDTENRFLKDTNIGLSAGLDGAWMELGYKNALCNRILIRQIL